MKRVFAVAVLLCAFAWPAYADVTVKMVTTGPAMGPAPGGGRAGATSEVPTTYSIKGNKARIDMVMAGHEMSTILDPASHQMISMNPETKEAIVYDLSKLTQQMEQTVKMGEVKVSMTPTGETKQLLGRTCTGYMLSVTMPMGGRGDETSQMTVTLGGPIWIAKDAPGTKDFATFCKAAASSGLFSLRAGGGGRGNPGMPEIGLATMYKAIGEAGGIPYEQEMQVKLEGSGPMADVMRGRGPMPPTVTKVTSVSTDPIPDDTFQIPAGYTKRIQ